ncbi:MAG: transposase [Chloroflexi bacterium]|nr:transposase [Chloroflexota bacterium]
MSKYSEETKAAVLAALLAGQSINSVAREYKIPPGTISNWKNRQGVPKNGIQKKVDSIGELLVSYLQTNLKTLQKQAEIFGDETWLKKQTASDAAVLHGVMTDKSVRLLEAMNATGDTTTES